MSQTAIQTSEGRALPESGAWTLDKHHSTVGFTARHLMVSKVRGSFRSFDATLHIADTVEGSWAEATVDAASIDTGDEMRDNHLRSADFLDVERYPHLSFRSANVQRVGDDRLRVTGDLTIRDVTRPVVLDVTYEGINVDPMGSEHAGFSISTEVDREEFGITWNVALEAGGVLVGKRVKIEIDIEAVRAA